MVNLCKLLGPLNINEGATALNKKKFKINFCVRYYTCNCLNLRILDL